MRRTALVAIPICLALAGCGTEGAAGKPRATDPVETSSEVTRIEAFNTLADDVNGFFAAAIAAERRRPEASPATAEEMLALVDYEFHPDVTLVTYSEAEATMCFTGPHDTYLTLSEPESDLQRTLGTGAECDYLDGDVVTEIGLVDDPPAGAGSGVLFEERIVKGEDVAAQVPALASFVDVINDSVGR